MWDPNLTVGHPTGATRDKHQIIPTPQGFWGPDWNEAPLNPAMGIPNKQSSATMPQVFPQRPPVNGHFFPTQAMEANHTVTNAEADASCNSAIPNYSSQQPNMEGFVYPRLQSAELNAQNYYPGFAGDVPGAGFQQYSVTSPQNWGRMVYYSEGRKHHAATVLQHTRAEHIKGLQYATRASQIRATIVSLGDCTPPRGAPVYRRPAHEQEMNFGTHISRIKDEEMVDNVKNGALEKIPYAQNLATLGEQWQSYEREMTPTQRRNTMISHTMSRSLSPPKELKFEAPSTPQNFKYPTCKRNSQKTTSPYERKKTSRVRMASSSSKEATASSTPASFAAVSLSMRAQDQLVASFQPGTGRPLICSVPVNGSFIGSFVPNSDPSVRYSLDLSGHTASASMSGPGPNVSCSLDVGNQAHLVSDAFETFPVYNGPPLGEQQVAGGFECPDHHHLPTMIMSPASDITYKDGYSNSNEKVLRLESYAENAVVPVSAPPPALDRNGIETSQDTTTKASTGRTFLDADHLDELPDARVGGESSAANPNTLEGQPCSENAANPQEDWSFFADLDDNNDNVSFDQLNFESWVDNIPDL